MAKVAAAKRPPLSRRAFLAVGGAAAAAGALPLRAEEQEPAPAEKAAPSIAAWRTLGRTGFKVSDIALGGNATDANLIRYAYDHGVNYFDTAESYGNGDNERLIGEAMQFIDRSKIFITTKLEMKKGESEASILERYGACLERMKTDHADALFMHGVSTAEVVKLEAYHKALARLKADGRVKHAGISCHGPREEGEDSLEKVLGAAVEDGRFDLVLMSYNFMNKDEAERVLALCKAKKVGTTAMKTAPGTYQPPPFDPANPAPTYQRYMDRMAEEEGKSRDEAVKEIHDWLAGLAEQYEKTSPFREEHGITSPEELRLAAVKWVLQNPDMHTVCMGVRDFETLDRFLALSGSTMARSEQRMLEGFKQTHNSLYCRHGCSQCLAACANRVPVSTIMRYTYYFTGQGREKHAMSKYAALGARNASLCLGCTAPCTGACPHGVNIKANLMAADALLRLA